MLLVASVTSVQEIADKVLNISHINRHRLILPIIQFTKIFNAVVMDDALLDYIQVLVVDVGVDGQFNQVTNHRFAHQIEISRCREDRYKIYMCYSSAFTPSTIFTYVAAALEYKLITALRTNCRMIAAVTGLLFARHGVCTIGGIHHIVLVIIDFLLHFMPHIDQGVANRHGATRTGRRVVMCSSACGIAWA